VDSTPASLLDRLRRPDPVAWERFVALYTPLLRRWAARLGADGPDAADLVQDVLTSLVRALPGFSYDPGRRFRGWLWTVTANKWRETRRQAPTAATAAPDELANLAVPDGTEAVDDVEYNQYLTAQAMRLMRAEFAPAHWQAFWESAVDGRPAAEIAARLGVSVAVVYAAKSRVLRRLREELAGLLD
jgi:RNA polymerase sigma-70 factor (ECF subfamily)